MKITSRYSDLDDVSYSERDIPSELRELYTFSKEWCLSDPEEVELLAKTKEEQEVQSFIELFRSHQGEIENYVQKGLEKIPVADSVVIMDLAFQSYDILLSQRGKE